MHRLACAVNVESGGSHKLQLLLLEAIRVMREKITASKSAAEAHRAQGDPGGDVEMAYIEHKVVSLLPSALL